MFTRIAASRLGKSYRLRHQGEAKQYRRLSEEVWRAVKSPLATWRAGRQTTETFWALRDVDFEIKDGEVVGIIGRNGAGKSTLLKLLSRITEPTTGRIELDGRVASLLEVGTGFHPELTGRENIFLNGAILGMSCEEIRRKFDEIVAFAEVERFLDTPVKRYSSGMYVRLAFAVAAHLEPEILIVDEVLAVGDAQFQKKCLGKMQSVASGGRTVLFVSHQMGAISQLCNRCLYLKSGHLIRDGVTELVIDQYLKDGEGGAFRRSGSTAQLENPPAYISRAATANSSGTVTTYFAHDEEVSLTVEICLPGSTPRGLACSIALQDHLNRRVFTDYKLLDHLSGEENYDLNIRLPVGLIAPGTYAFIVTLHTFQCEVFDRKDRICEFQIVDNGTHLTMFKAGEAGCLNARCEWEINHLVTS